MNFKTSRKIGFVAGMSLLSGLAGILFSTAALADSTFNGYLIDRACEASIKHDKKDPLPELKRHTKECSLSPDCSEAGYSLYSNGKFIDLDSKSNALAKKYFQSTTRKEGHYVAVSGEMKRDMLSVEDIKDANQP